MCHNTFVEVVCRALWRGGVACIEEPRLSALFPHPHPAATTAAAPPTVLRGPPLPPSAIHVATATRAASPSQPTPPGAFPGAFPGAPLPVPSPAHTSTSGHCTAPEEAHVDILYVFQDRLTVGDVAVIHPGSSTYRRSAAQRPGAAAAHCNAAKITKLRRREDARYTFVPMSIKTHGRLGAPVMDLFRHICCKAAECSEFTFVERPVCVWGS
jgi:hypothetical protein